MTDKIDKDFLEDGKSFVRLVDYMHCDTSLKTVNAARASYDTEKQEFDDKDKKLTKFLWAEEHTSPYRHSYYTFQIKLPIYVARQLMKYQVGSGFRSIEADGSEVFIKEFDHLYDIDKGCSWNEVSGRYVKTSDEYYIPSELRSNPGHGNKQSSGEYINPLSPNDANYFSPKGIVRAMHDFCSKSLELYNKLVANGVARELARGVLPGSLYTKVYWTVSLQSIIWFLHQRLKPDAQQEIKQLAEAVDDLMETDLNRLGIEKSDL